VPESRERELRAIPEANRIRAICAPVFVQTYIPTYRADRCRGRPLTKTESAKTNLACETLGINPVKYEPLASRGFKIFARTVCTVPRSRRYFTARPIVYFSCYCYPFSLPDSPVAVYSEHIAFRENITRPVFRLSIRRVFNMILIKPREIKPLTVSH